MVYLKLPLQPSSTWEDHTNSSGKLAFGLRIKLEPSKYNAGLQTIPLQYLVKAFVNFEILPEILVCHGY
jgi:hypothetical protein